MLRCHIVFEYFWNFNRELGGGWSKRKKNDIKRGILQQILVLLPWGSFLYLVYINVAILCLYTVLFCYQQTLEKKRLLENDSLHIKGSFILFLLFGLVSSGLLLFSVCATCLSCDKMYMMCWYSESPDSLSCSLSWIQNVSMMLSPWQLARRWSWKHQVKDTEQRSSCFCHNTTKDSWVKYSGQLAQR